MLHITQSAQMLSLVLAHRGMPCLHHTYIRPKPTPPKQQAEAVESQHKNRKFKSRDQRERAKKGRASVISLSQQRFHQVSKELDSEGDTEYTRQRDSEVETARGRQHG